MSIPAWDVIKTIDVVLLHTKGKPPHVLFAGPGQRRDQLRNPGNAAYVASRYINEQLIAPIRSKKLGPQLTKAIAAIERAHNDGMYKLVLQLWRKRRPPTYPVVLLRRVYLSELNQPPQ